MENPLQQVDSQIMTYQSNPLQLLPLAWQALKLNLRAAVGFLALIGLGFVILVAVTAAGATSIAHGSVTPQNVVPLLSILVLLGMLFAVVMLFLTPFAVKLALESAKLQSLGFRQLFSMDRKTYWNVLGTALLTGLAISVGFLLLIVPGVIFMAWFGFASYIALDEGLSPRAALKRSRELVRQHMTETYAVLLVPSAVSVVGFIPILGTIVFYGVTILYVFVPAIRYLQLKHLKGSGAPKPALSGWNWAVIVAALVLGGAFQSAQFNHNLQQQRQLQQPADSTYHT